MQHNLTLTLVGEAKTVGNCKDINTMDCHHRAYLYPFLSILVPAIERLGHKWEVVDWADDSVDWQSRQHVIIVNTWDYSSKLNKFHAWLDRL